MFIRILNIHPCLAFYKKANIILTIFMDNVFGGLSSNNRINLVITRTTNYSEFDGSNASYHSAAVQILSFVEIQIFVRIH